MYVKPGSCSDVKLYAYSDPALLHKVYPGIFFLSRTGSLKCELMVMYFNHFKRSSFILLFNFLFICQ